jgi:hypothetical protein
METRVTREAVTEGDVVGLKVNIGEMVKLKRMRVVEAMAKCIRLLPEDGAGPKLLVRYSEVRLLEGEQYGVRARPVPRPAQSVAAPFREIVKPMPAPPPAAAIEESPRVLGPSEKVRSALEDFASLGALATDIAGNLAVHAADLQRRRSGLLDEIDAMREEVESIEAEHRRVSGMIDSLKGLRSA